MADNYNDLVNYGVLSSDTKNLLQKQRPDLLPGNQVQGPSEIPQVAPMFLAPGTLSEPLVPQTQQIPQRPIAESLAEYQALSNPMQQTPGPAQPVAPVQAVNPNASIENLYNTLYPNTGLKMANEAITNIGKANAEQGAKTATAMGNIVDQMKEMETNRQIKEQNRMAEVQKRMDAVDQAAKQVPDFHNFWSDKSTGQKILASFAMGLGAVGAGLARTSNFAMDTINKAIENDMITQKAQIAKAQGHLENVRGTYKDYLQMLGDERHADAAYRANALDVTKMQLAQLESQYKEPIAKANAQLQLSQIQTQIDAQKGQLGQMLYHQQALKEAGGTSGMSTFLTPEERERTVPGFGMAPSKEDASKFKETAIPVQSALSTINELNRLAEKPGKSLSPLERERASVLQSTLLGDLKNIYYPGVRPSPEIMEHIKSMIPTPTDIFQWDTRDKIKTQTLQKSLSDKIQGLAQIHGLKSVQNLKTLNQNVED